MDDLTAEQTATIRAISLDDFDRDTLRIVAMTYRKMRRASYSDLAAFNSAMVNYRERHPDVPEGRAAEIVGKMIAAGINADPVWFWRAIPRDIRYQD